MKNTISKLQIQRFIFVMMILGLIFVQSYSAEAVQSIGESNTFAIGESNTFAIDTTQQDPLEPFDLLSPPNGGWTTDSTPDFDWTDTDGNPGLSHYQLWIDGNLIQDNIFESHYTLTAGQALSNGEHTWAITAVDTAGGARGARQIWMIVLGVDDTPPIPFDLVSPPDGEWGTVTATFDWDNSNDDISGISHYELWIDSSLIQGNIPESNYTLTDAQQLSEGFHTWTVYAFDYAGNSTQANQTWTFRVDLTPPANFALISPEDGSWSTEIPTFSWQPSGDADSGLWKYQLYIDEELAVDDIPPTDTSTTISGGKFFSDDFESGTSKWILDSPWGRTSSTAQSGSYSLTDSPSGNYDNYADTRATIAQNINLSRISTAMLTFWHKYFFESNYDYGRIEVSTDGGSSWEQIKSYTGTQSGWTQVTLPLDSYTGTSQFKLRFRLTSSSSGTYDGWYIDDVEISTGVDPLPQGSHTWYVLAVDVVGNETQADDSPWMFGVDNTPPPSPTLISPENNGCTTDTPTFIWEAVVDEGAGLDKYQLWIDGELKIDNLHDTTVTLEPADALTQGNHTWFVKAIDLVGKKSQSATWTFKVDTVPPNSFDLVSPENGAWTDGTPTLDWNNSSDSGCGFSHYQLWIDGEIFADNITQSRYTITEEQMQSLGEGFTFDELLAKIESWATDAATNANLESWATDAGSAQNGQIRNLGYTGSLIGGFHFWTVYALDKAGNSTQANQTWTIRVDDASPMNFSLLTPENNSWTADTFPAFTWQASSDSESSLAKYQLWVNEALLVDNIPPESPFIDLGEPAFSDDFESGTSKWNLDAPWDITSATAHSGDYCLTDSPSGNYDNYSDIKATMAADVDLRLVSTATLTFWHKYELQTNYDYGKVEVSTNGGGSWREIKSYTSTQSSWTKVTLSLNNYVGIANFRLRFRLTSNSWTTYDGWYIDDVEITTSDALPAGDYDWYVIALDNVGNSTKSNETWMLHIDNIPPEPPTLNSPANNSWTATPNPEFTWNEAVDFGVGGVTYQLWVDSALVVDNIVDTQIALAPEQALTNGSHLWSVVAIDALGNKNQSTTWTIKVDTLPPSPFSLSSPADGEYVPLPTPNFSWNSTSDAGCGLDHYELWIDDAVDRDNIPAGTTTTSPKNPLTEGEHTWRIIVVDKIGNKNQSDATWKVIVDWTTPSAFNLIPPKMGQKFSSLVRRYRGKPRRTQVRASPNISYG